MTWVTSVGNCPPELQKVFRDFPEKSSGKDELSDLRGRRDYALAAVAGVQESLALKCYLEECLAEIEGGVL